MFSLHTNLLRFKQNWRVWLLRQAVGVVVFATALYLIPHRWCALGARAWFDGELPVQQRLARGVEENLRAEVDITRYATGSGVFDGEWLFGTYQMAGLGFAQTALEHPELRARHVELIELCVERMLDERVRAFDKQAWGDDPIESLASGRGHAAYLGYANCVLSYLRLLSPSNRYAKLNDEITAALARRVTESSTLLIETYPAEIYPVDNCAVIASIALYDRATGRDHATLIKRWLGRCREKYVDRRTGLFYQAVSANGAPADAARGSGTCLGLYFLSLVDDSLSAELYQAVRRELAGKFLGFGAVHEYPASAPAGSGDIDSGPILLGYSISATGFCVAGARIHADREYFGRLYSTAHLFGAPRNSGESQHFVTGGPLGDAIMFAMLTAQPRSTLYPSGKTSRK